MSEQKNNVQSQVIHINEADLPLHCPQDDAPLWNQHPRVFLTLDEHGKASCPYCGTQYQQQ